MNTTFFLSKEDNKTAIPEGGGVLERVSGVTDKQTDEEGNLFDSFAIAQTRREGIVVEV